MSYGRRMEGRKKGIVKGGNKQGVKEGVRRDEEGWTEWMGRRDAGSQRVRDKVSEGVGVVA